MSRLSTRVLASTLLIILGACDRPPALNEADLVAVASQPLRIQIGEKVRVSVFGEANITGDYDVDPAGFITVPLAGRIHAEGQTKVSLEAALTSKLRSDYLRDPKVNVDVVLFRPFYMTGEVERVGEVPYRAGVNVITALALAGGASFRASQNRVLIKRAGEVDFHEYPMSSLVPIYPGDVVRVPERYF